MATNNKGMASSKSSGFTERVTSRPGATIVTKVINVPNHVKESISRNIGKGTSSGEPDARKISVKRS